MNPQPDPELELLRSGLESYLPAMNAIVAFRERIHRLCEQVLFDHLSEYAKALGVRLKKDDIVRREYPSVRQWDSEWTSVGVEIQWVGPCRTWLWHSVAWDLSATGACEFSVSESMWFPKKGHYERARKLLQPAPQGYWESERDVGISTPLTVADAPQIEEHLRTLLQRWIELWRGIGGLKALNGK